MKSINEICEEHKIKNYTINEDGTIDVDGEVNLSQRGLDELPLNFNRVTGNFYCNGNNLTTLKGSPKYVGGGFYCGYNDLPSLEFGPIEVGGTFDCERNLIRSLEYSPIKVGSDFRFPDNKVRSFKYCPDKVSGNILAYDNSIKNIDGITYNIGGVLYCLNNPIGVLLNGQDAEFIIAFNSYRVIKDDKIVLKRLKYVMELFKEEYNLDKIKKHYEII